MIALCLAHISKHVHAILLDLYLKGASQYCIQVSSFGTRVAQKCLKTSAMRRKHKSWICTNGSILNREKNALTCFPVVGAHTPHVFIFFLIQFNATLYVFIFSIYSNVNHFLVPVFNFFVFPLETLSFYRFWFKKRQLALPNIFLPCLFRFSNFTE